MIPLVVRFCFQYTCLSPGETRIVCFFFLFKRVPIRSEIEGILGTLNQWSSSQWLWSFQTTNDVQLYLITYSSRIIAAHANQIIKFSINLTLVNLRSTGSTSPIGEFFTVCKYYSREPGTKPWCPTVWPPPGVAPVTLSGVTWLWWSKMPWSDRNRRIGSYLLFCFVPLCLNKSSQQQLFFEISVLRTLFSWET